MACFSLLYAYLILLSLPYAIAAPAAVSSQNGTFAARSTPGSKNVIIQLFEWVLAFNDGDAQILTVFFFVKTWDSIASECKNFIGPAGYGYIQG